MLLSSMLREGPRNRPRLGSRSYSGAMREYDEGPDDLMPDPFDEGPVELIRPEDFLGHNGIPRDAKRMGFDRNTEEGALIALAGSLNPGKRSHRIVAWILLVTFAVPLMLGLTHLMY